MTVKQFNYEVGHRRHGPIGGLVVGMLTTGVKGPERPYLGDPFVATKFYGRAMLPPMGNKDGSPDNGPDLEVDVRKNGSVIGAFVIQGRNVTNKAYTGSNLTDLRMTGTVVITSGSAAVVGTSTLFTTQIAVGETIIVSATPDEERVVDTITDDTHLTVTSNFTNTNNNRTAKRKGYAIAVQVNDGDYFDLNIIQLGSAPNEGGWLAWVVT